MGKDISSIGLDEEEVLYKRNTEFLIISKKKINDVYHITIEEVFNG
ncbi:hypothetical protein [uncultured Finegoldia sp.]|nr:hypothetical protein [uncultured Finegoldia sp.]